MKAIILNGTRVSGTSKDGREYDFSSLSVLYCSGGLWICKGGKTSKGQSANLNVSPSIFNADSFDYPCVVEISTGLTGEILAISALQSAAQADMESALSDLAVVLA